MSFSDTFHPFWDIVDAVTSTAHKTRPQRQHNRRALAKRHGEGDWMVSPFASDWFGEEYARAPAIDFYDTPNNYTVVASVAGCSPDEVNIDFDSQTGELTVSGETSYSYDSSMDPEESDKHRKDYCKVSERQYGRFSRTIQLPTDSPINEDEILADIENGVLKITVPKMEPDKKKEKKKIKVNKAKAAENQG